MDDSKLRLRRTAQVLSPLAVEEGLGGEGSGSMHRNGSSRSTKSFDDSNNKNNNFDRCAVANGNFPDKIASPTRRIKRRVKRRRRRALVWKYCKLFLGGLVAAIVSATLSVTLLPFSWTQVDYHHQFQHEVQYVYQNLVDSRRNYHSVIDHYHSDGRKLGKNSVISGEQNDLKPSLRRPEIPVNNQPEVIKCGDGSIGFKNDDYCDCPLDGLDEPDTSACSNVLVQKTKFVCGRRPRGMEEKKTPAAARAAAAAKPTTTWIYASRVNDGIIDCPDGSDEYGHVLEDQNMLSI